MAFCTNTRRATLKRLACAVQLQAANQRASLLEAQLEKTAARCHTLDTALRENIEEKMSLTKQVSHTLYESVVSKITVPSLLAVNQRGCINGVMTHASATAVGNTRPQSDERFGGEGMQRFGAQIVFCVLACCNVLCLVIQDIPGKEHLTRALS
jgi:hypothetical protein